jgi:hypothetical protein
MNQQDRHPSETHARPDAQALEYRTTGPITDFLCHLADAEERGQWARAAELRGAFLRGKIRR